MPVPIRNHCRRRNGSEMAFITFSNPANQETERRRRAPAPGRMHFNNQSVRHPLRPPPEKPPQSDSVFQSRVRGRRSPADAKDHVPMPRLPDRMCSASPFEVLIPRSQSTTSLLPPESKYSAASNHSFTVADGPRFNRIGFLTVASLRNSAKFCMFRAPTCSMSTTRRSCPHLPCSSLLSPPEARILRVLRAESSALPLQS